MSSTSTSNHEIDDENDIDFSVSRNFTGSGTDNSSSPSEIKRELGIVGLRKKKRKSWNFNLKTDKVIDDDVSSYFRFSEIPTDEMITLYYDEIQSDDTRKDQFGFYYKDLRTVKVVYSYKGCDTKGFVIFCIEGFQGNHLINC